MLKQLNSIRYMYIRSHLYGLILNTFILLAVLLSIHVWFEPEWLSPGAILFFILSYIIIGFFMSLYAGFKSSGDMKQRFDYISTMITQLSRGEFSSKIYFNENDEVAGLGDELNELGEKLKQQKESLLKLADEKADLARSAHKAATIEERQRLARDLHDAVSQQLFALTMMAQAARKVFDKNPVKAREQLEEITQMALQAQTEMRALLLHLRPVHLSGEPLTEGISSLIEELKQKCPLHFQVQMEEMEEMSRTTEEQLFRVVQEALSNILRHANATEVKIGLNHSKGEMFLHISDNGAGFDPDEKKGNKASYGLKTMKERCEEIGGEFTIRSREGEGTHIDIRVPILLQTEEEST
ncbi:sensor histidine kinase [Halobacillus sp. BBL2006]|uniref:sensor histidine kinase n=1 Tax=Halobacillus sp. BBL2006 TaxID=1543706 RepID=UPI00054353A2|nr:sensor histidine kinase [Halobacillus sp. BBL2006]KHE71918.1 histidine kinase [Halobacillus sp. BBL2006]